MYLLDTNILSEARRAQRPVAQWINSVDSDLLFVSVISLGEIEKGIARRQSDPTFAASLRDWQTETIRAFTDHTLPVTVDIALAWGKISAGRTRDAADALIAATALVHGMTLVTRNIRDFADLPIKWLDPWSA